MSMISFVVILCYINMKRLSLKDVDFHKASTLAGAYLFWYNNNLYRAPYAKHIEIFQELYNANYVGIQNLYTTNFEFDDGQNILPVYRHKYYDHLVAAIETVPYRMKQIIHLICELNIELLKRKYILDDIHGYNICDTIDGIKFIDVPSVVNVSDSTHSVKQFIEFMRFGNEISNKLRRYKINSPETWQEISDIVDTITTTATDTHWYNQYGKTHSTLQTIQNSNKTELITSILKDVRFKTVTDVGCNKGYFLFYLANKYNINSGVGIDIDEGCIDYAIKLNEEYKYPVIFSNANIHSLYNYNNYFKRESFPQRECTYTFDSQKDRYSSELVMALALVHHACKVMSHEDIAKFLAGISKKYILIEDIGESLRSYSTLKTTAPVYQQEFKALGFNLIKRIKSIPSDRSLSLYCKT